MNSQHRNNGVVANHPHSSPHPHILPNPYILLERDPKVEALVPPSCPNKFVHGEGSIMTQEDISVITLSDAEDEEIEDKSKGGEDKAVLVNYHNPPSSPQPPSSSSTTAPSPKRRKYNFEKFVETEADKTKEGLTERRRLDYLLKKSEFFTRRLTSGDAVIAAQQDKKVPAVRGPGRNRHRKAEKEEDAQLLQNDETLVDGSGVHSAIVTFTKTPPYIKNGEMRDYQIRGLNWLINLYENGINGILADEMGLGKTVQTISLLGYLKHYRSVGGHYLIIIPKSTMGNWENEFKRWCPSMRTVSLLGNPETRKAIINNQILRLNKWDVLITTYDMVLKEKHMLKRITWTYLIIDEGQRIKNENTKLAVYVREFESRHRLLLTGTPLQNNLHELWALLNFLLPDVFNSAENFDSWFNTESCLGDNSLLTRLHSILRPFLLRRIKSEVEKSLLPKIEVKVYVPLTIMQRTWYKKVLLRDLEILNAAGEATRVRLFNLLIQLRKCCNHPYLFTGAEAGPPYDVGTHLASNSGKLLVLDKLLLKLKGEGSRVLIFCQMTRFMDILEDYCFWRKFKYHRLDGSTAHTERQYMIDEYNSPSSPTFIFMLSTRSGGLGINLASADVVVIYDSDWNPQVDLQAMDRAHRIGQTKQVRVFRLITENTVEEKIVERAAVKLKLDNVVIKQGRLVDSAINPNKDDLLNWVRYGAALILDDNTGDQTIPDETIESILERSKCKDDQINGKLDSLEESNLRNLVMESSVYNFEGEDYRDKLKIKKKEDDAVGKQLEFIGLSKRARKVVDYSKAMTTRKNTYTKEYDADYKREPTTKKEMVAVVKEIIETKPKLGVVKKTTNPKEPVDYVAYRMTAAVGHHTNGNTANPIIPKLHPILPNHQFYPKRLFDLLQKEVDYHQKLIGYKVDVKPDILHPSYLHTFKKIDTGTPLTVEEFEEKKALLQQGFPRWSRKDFLEFLKLQQQYGHDSFELARFSDSIEGKTMTEVIEYGNAFRQRYVEFDAAAAEKMPKFQPGHNNTDDDLENYIVARLLSTRIAFCENFNLKLRVPYPYTNCIFVDPDHIDFTVEEDRLLILIWNKFGLQNYGSDTWLYISQQVKERKQGEFSSLKLRTRDEIQERCIFLWSLFKDSLNEEGGFTKKEVTRIKKEVVGENGPSSSSSKKEDEALPALPSEKETVIIDD